MEKKGLLLHVCCAPCASGCLDRLTDRKVVLYFSNSNINTEAEYEKRLENVRILAKAYDLEVITDPYRHDLWLNAVSSVENYAEQPERGLRCTACFSWSLQRTAEKAAGLGMNFATTLTVSPHKDSKRIFSIGEKYPHFEKWDFKKQDGFLKSIRKSRELGLYRQNYCGCEFSFNNHES